MRDLLGNLVDLLALLLDHMLLDLTDVRVDFLQDVLLGLSQLLEFDKQVVLPGGDAVHPPEADDPCARTYPRQHVSDGFVIHSALLFEESMPYMRAVFKPQKNNAAIRRHLCLRKMWRYRKAGWKWYKLVFYGRGDT
jgi:hypothetical protein